MTVKKKIQEATKRLYSEVKFKTLQEVKNDDHPLTHMCWDLGLY